MGIAREMIDAGVWLDGLKSIALDFILRQTKLGIRQIAEFEAGSFAAYGWTWLRWRASRGYVGWRGRSWTDASLLAHLRRILKPVVATP